MKNRTMALKLERAHVQAREAAVIEDAGNGVEF
jgi:hypothetical protein